MQKSAVVLLIGTRSKPDVLILDINGTRYEYETSPFHIDKFKFVYRKSHLKALSYIKKNSSSWRKLEEPLWWLSFSEAGVGPKGVIITAAPSKLDALQKLLTLKIVPEHNDLQIYPVSPEEAKLFPMDRLVTRRELEEHKYEVKKEPGKCCPFHGPRRDE